MPEPQFDAREYLRKSQSRLIPGVHDKPFLEEPAAFQTARDPADVLRAEAKQHVPIPATKDPPVMDLAEVIGQAAVDEIQRSGQFVFHAVGDTGNPKHSDLGDVVPVMARDYYRPDPADRPAIFLHLGDVCYNLYDEQTKKAIPQPKSGMYRAQFYLPYADYPGKIIAIPGNHDSNPEEDPNSLAAFRANFCAALGNDEAKLQELVRSKTRTPMYQPGVYYRFDAPYAQFICLFSNGGETAGVIRDHPGVQVGNDQWEFLLAQLSAIKAERDADPAKRRALFLAVHHPPFSGGGGHPGSAVLLADLDLAFSQAGVVPDVVLAGHAHSYQRFTRSVTGADGKSVEVPYVVAGNGGHGITGLKPNASGGRVRTPLEGKAAAAGGPAASLRQYFDGFGHLVVTVKPNVVTVDLIGTHTNTSKPVDSVTLALDTRKVTHETPPFAHPAVGEKEKFHTA